VVFYGWVSSYFGHTRNTYVHVHDHGHVLPLLNYTIPPSGQLVTAFLDQRTSPTGFAFTSQDTEFINTTMAPKLPNVVLSLLNDPAVVNSCLQNPGMQQFVQQLQSELDLNNYLLEDADASNSASTATPGHDSEDDLGSRRTYVGDNEEYSSEEEEHDHGHGRGHKCFACGQSKTISIKRPRSSSTSSVGAGSPPKTVLSAIPDWAPKIGSILSIAIVVLVVKFQVGVDISYLLGRFSFSSTTK